MSGIQQSVGQMSARWHFHAWHRCHAAEPERTFADQTTALRWLAQLTSDAGVMIQLRALAAYLNVGGTLTRASDHQVLEALSWQLARGVLHAHSVPAAATDFHTGQQSRSEKEDQSTVSSPRRASVQPKPAVIAEKVPQEADTLSAGVDGAATAAALRNAAATGVPFCEECAKAATAARQAA